MPEPRPAYRGVQPAPEQLAAMVRTLRRKGLGIGTGEAVDAASAMTVLGLADREQLRVGLAACLVRLVGHRGVFDAAFDLYFPAGPVARRRPEMPETDPERIRARVVDVLAGDDRTRLDAVAADAVTVLGEVAGRAGAGWSELQTRRRLELQDLEAEASGRRALVDTLSAGWAVGEVAVRAEALRTAIGTEVRRRTAELRGTGRVAEHAVPESAELTDFLQGDAAQLERLESLVRPLALRLATTLAGRRRRRSRGAVDVRATLRRSMSTGGVPFDIRHVRPRPRRPRLVLLCDMSGSVSGFSGSTISRVRALHEHLGRSRFVAFVNHPVDLTNTLRDDSEPTRDLVERILRDFELRHVHANSDYGRVFEKLAAQSGVIEPRSTLIVLGDARNNYQPSGERALEHLVRQGRRAFWLNPEPRSLWGLSDSEALRYRTLVPMHECRNAAQLARFIAELPRG